MKIIASLLIVLVAIPLCISMATSYIAESHDLLPQDEYAPIFLVSNKLSSEPAIMILIGFGLIGIAGIGRRKLLNKESSQERPISLTSNRQPLPDPVPWKKET